MPKSFVGPGVAQGQRAAESEPGCLSTRQEILTTRVVAGSQENTASGLPLPDDMTGSGCGQNAVLADEKLLDTVCGTNLCDQLNDLGVPEPAITTNNQEGAFFLCQSSWVLLVGLEAE